MTVAILCGSLLAASPALAESGNSLPGGGGHTCLANIDDYSYKGVFCLDLGLYTTRSGKQFLTAQVEMICSKDSTGKTVPCLIGSDATATVADVGGYTDWTQQQCNNQPCTVSQTTGRTYMYPFGGLAISPGICYADVWASIEEGQSAQVYPDGLVYSLEYSFTTPQYKVCESIYGVMSYTLL